MENRINNQQSVFDETALLQRIMDDKCLGQSIIALFLTELPGHILKLKQAVGAGDAVNARLQAHTIRGASANVAANNLWRVSHQAEEYSEKGDLENCLACIPILEAEFCLFREVIETSHLVSNRQEKL